MLTQTSEKKTYRDYDELPEGAPYQLISGDLVMNPSPNFFHQRIVMRLSNSLFMFVEQHKLGEVVPSPVDVYLKDTEVYQPDVVFISKERLGIINEGRIKGAPDLIIEILSPSTGYYDLTHKRNVYESSGVKEYWIADPDEETIEVLENVNGEFIRIVRQKQTGIVTSKLLMGFSVKVEDIF